MPTICPTVLAQDSHDFRTQMERIAPFARRIQIDLADGNFAPNKTIGMKHVWLPPDIITDLHVMYQEPAKYLKDFIKLQPHMVIVHAEASGDFEVLAIALHSAGIKIGVALLPETPVDSLQTSIDYVDHVLIFGGTLGHFGGHADLSLLDKVAKLKSLRPELEVGWDGGVNDLNIARLAAGGVDVINVGGFIQHAVDPAHAYVILKSLAENKT